jgi:hypothetical protein
MPQYLVKTLAVHTHSVEAPTAAEAAKTFEPTLRHDKDGHPDTVKLLSIEPIAEEIPA